MPGVSQYSEGNHGNQLIRKGQQSATDFNAFALGNSHAR